MREEKKQQQQQRIERRKKKGEEKEEEQRMASESFIRVCIPHPLNGFLINPKIIRADPSYSHSTGDALPPLLCSCFICSLESCLLCVLYLMRFMEAKRDMNVARGKESRVDPRSPVLRRHRHHL